LSFSLFSSFLVYRGKINDKIILICILFVNLILLIYSMLSFYSFYQSGFFEKTINELIYFEHGFLAGVTIIPMIIVVFRNWNQIPKIKSVIYFLINISNIVFLSMENYFISIIHIFFIILLGSHIGMYSIFSKSHSKKAKVKK
ncbi:MAG: hypothetical protein JXL97_05440, partial [Bacteroidales bacterium]|nr:hypothetical protein [Bacteroidales bacterium]